MNATKKKRLQQMAFNAAYRGLKWQGFERAMDSNGFCLTRARALSGPDRQCCALGWCIPDGPGDYVGMRSWPNCGPVASVLFVAGSGVGPCDADMLTPFADELAHCHDGGETPSVMEARLRDFARRWGLTVPDE